MKLGRSLPLYVILPLLFVVATSVWAVNEFVYYQETRYTIRSVNSPTTITHLDMATGRNSTTGRLDYIKADISNSLSTPVTIKVSINFYNFAEGKFAYANQNVLLPLSGTNTGVRVNLNWLFGNMTQFYSGEITTTFVG